MCPSDAVFTISLGPTNPWLIDIAKETSVFRRRRFSLRLRLLVPTFLLPNAPAWVTPSPSQQIGILSYCRAHNKLCARPPVSVLHLSPDYLRRKISYWVSCYAIFQGWLLLSLPPQCLRNSTTLSALSVNLGTLNWDPGCFPFDQWSLAPIV